MAIIGTIRKHSGIAVAVVGIAIVAFIIGDVFKRQSSVPDFAEIDGETVLNTYFEQKVQEEEERLKRQQGIDQIPSDKTFEFREQVWNQILEEKIYGKQLEALGIVVSQAELSDMYLGEFIHPFLKQQFTDPSTGIYNSQIVKQYVQNFDQLKPEDQLQWADIEQYVSKSRLYEKYNMLLAKSFYTPKAIAEKIVAMSAKSADARVIALSPQTITDDQIKITDADYEKYYNEHKKMFKQENSRDIDFVQFPVVPTQKDLADIENKFMESWKEFQTIEDEYAAAFVNQISDVWYDSSYVKSSAFLSMAPLDTLISQTPAGGFVEPRLIGNKWVMAKVLKAENRPDSLRASAIIILNNKAEGISRSEAEAKSLTDSVEALIKSGKMSFEEAVASFSDDPTKGDNQGDMKWTTDGGYGFLNEKIVESPEGTVFTYERPDKVGYYIVKVTGKTAASKKYRVALVTNEIKASKETYDAAYQKANAFLSKVATHDAFVATAQKENLMVHNSDFTPSNVKSLQGVSEAREIVRWAFNEERVVGEVSETIYESDDNYVVASLKEIRKKGYATLDQVKIYIEPMVKQEKRLEMLAEKAEKTMASTKDINALATQLGSSVDSVTGINFNGYTFGNYGPEMKAIGTVAAAGKTGLLKPIKGDYNVYVVNVDAINQNPQMPDAKLMAQQMEMENSQKLRTLFDVLKDKIEIKDNRIAFQ